MRHIKTSVVGALVFLLSTTNLQAKEWRGIVPLKSTRADVERLLGSPGAHGRYQFKNERAYIHYAGSSCDRVDDCWCVAPKDTVTRIYVELETELRFSALKLDRTKYEKYASPQDPTIATYSNDAEGIIYTVDEENDDVIAIEYLPSAKDCQELVKRRARR